MTSEELAILNQDITDARAAYKSLMLGQMAKVFVDQNGERVEFTSVNKADLYAYIQSLVSQLPGSCQRRTKPIGYLF